MMKKRKSGLLQRMMAVLLSAVLVTGMVSNAVPTIVFAQEDGETVETTQAEESKEPAKEETKSGEQDADKPDGSEDTNQEDKEDGDSEDPETGDQGNGEPENPETGDQGNGTPENPETGDQGNGEPENPETGDQENGAPEDGAGLENPEPETDGENTAADEETEILQALLARIDALPDAEEYLAGEPDTDNGEVDMAAYEEWLTGLYAYAEEALSIQEAVEELSEEVQAAIPEEAFAKLAAWAEAAQTVGESVQVMAVESSMVMAAEPNNASSNGWTLDANGKLTITSDEGWDGWIAEKVKWIDGQRYAWKVKSVEIQNTVTVIPETAFESCTNVKKITIPGSVTSIGNGAFIWVNLSDITMQGTTPPTLGADVFKSCYFVNNGLQGIHVPEGTEEIYKTTWTQWKDYITSHSWSSQWESNETHHWHKCTNSDCAIVDNHNMKDYKEHVYANDSDTNCKTCGYERTTEITGISVGCDLTAARTAQIGDALTPVGSDISLTPSGMNIATGGWWKKGTGGYVEYSGATWEEGVYVRKISVWLSGENCIFADTLQITSPIGENWTVDERSDDNQTIILRSDKIVKNKTSPPTPAEKYTVTVNNGTGGGEYKAGDTVEITANAAPSGKQFDKWEVNSSNVTLADATSSTTTFTMPEEAVNVTATYKDKSGSGNQGGGNSGNDGSGSGGSGGNNGSSDNGSGSSGENNGSGHFGGSGNSGGSHGGNSAGGDNGGSGTTDGMQGGGNQAGGGSDGNSQNSGSAGSSSGNGGAGTTAPAPAGQPRVKQEQEGNIRKEVSVTGEHTLDASVAAPISELADMVLTQTEKQQAADGTNIQIVLDVKEMPAAVGAADRTVVEAALNSSLARGYTLGQYLDISLYKVVGDSRSAITQTNRKITVTIQVPDSLKNSDSTKTRTFAVIRVHDGKAQLLPDLDSNAETITIETDRFSIYAIVYQDTANADGGASVMNLSANSENATVNAKSDSGQKAGGGMDDEPQTGDATPIELCATLSMIAGFTYLLLYFADRKRGMTEETKKELVSRLIGWGKQGGKIRKYFALAAIFALLVYYHSIGKKTCVEWKEVYGE